MKGRKSPRLSRARVERLLGAAVIATAMLALSSCGGGSHAAQAAGEGRGSPPGATGTLPGSGKPTITVGDKNYTEQFVLGELYYQALGAQGFSVVLNRNIGPTEVTLSALESGTLSMYPESLETWNSTIAGYRRGFPSAYAAYQAGQRYALAHGLELLGATPFSDTEAIAVTFDYAVENGLRSIGDLQKVAPELALGGPPQFEDATTGLPAVEQAYGVVPGDFKALEVGAQYQALAQGTVQAADVGTTDAQLLTGNYNLLADPKRVFGWGNVVPVVSARVVDAEGPAFTATINKVSALLTLPVIRELNAAVDVSHEDPAEVAKQFLIAHNLIPRTSS